MSEDSLERRRREREERRKKREEALAAEEEELERKRAQRKKEREERRKALAEEEEKQEAERLRKREERRAKREAARAADEAASSGESLPMQTPRGEVIKYEKASSEREAERRAVERREAEEASKVAAEMEQKRAREAADREKKEETERKHAAVLAEEKRLEQEEKKLQKEREERHKREEEEKAASKKVSAAPKVSSEELEKLHDKLAETEDALTDANVALKRQERKTAVLTDDARSAAQEAQELSDENVRLLQQIKELKSSALDAASPQEVEELRRELKEIKGASGDSDSEQVKHLREQLESLKKENAKATRASNDQVESLQTKLEKAEKEIKSLKEEIASLKKAATNSKEVDDLKSKADKSAKEIKSLEGEVDSLKSENKELKAKAKSGSGSSSSSSSSESGKVKELEDQVASLERQLASQGSSAAPRLTSATAGRPSRRKPSNRRAGASTIETVEREEPAKSAYKPPGGGNPAMSVMAALAMQAKEKQGKKTLSSSSHSVHTSLGTKGGEITRTLYILKGKQRCRAVRVEDSVASITDSDVFILETASHLWTFCGKKSNRLKIARAVDVIGKMQRQRGQARAAKSVVVERETSQNAFDREREEWWKQFPEGKPAEIPMGKPDAEWEKEYEDSINLFRFTPDFQVELVQNGRLTREMLDTSECYILDSPTEVYCWTGRGSNTTFRKQCVIKAQEILHDAVEAGEKPDWVEVERVSENGEGAIFEDKFFKWPDSMRKVIGKVQHKKLSNVAISNKKQELPRIKTMHDGELLEQKEIVPDVEEYLENDPEIFIVKDFRRTELPKDEYGKFYASNCYVISYKYEDTAAIYFWLGRDAGFTEMGTAASLAKEYNGELGGKCNLLRVDQGRENRHFLGLFGGRMAVINGAREEKSPSTRLFQIRGSDKFDTRSFECPDINAVYLCSDDVFVVVSGGNKFTWVGGHASSFIKDTVAPYIEKEVCGSGSSKSIKEGSETDAFWKVLGGKSEYAKHEERSKKMPVKLFLCNNSNKVYNAHRTRLFVQNDLLHSHQAIVDRYTEVLIWVGVETKPDDKMLLVEVARDFVEKAKDGRPKDCKVLVMDEGEEHYSFTRYFQAWNPKKTKTAKKNIEIGPPRTDRKVFVDSDVLMKNEGGGNKYTLKELSDKDYLPAGVDKTKLEEYLRDEDFVECFGITAKEFRALPGWKRLQKKKGSILF